jgi:hypothetical protein
MKNLEHPPTPGLTTGQINSIKLPSAISPHIERRRNNLNVPLLGELVPRGDGSFILKPTLPEKNLKNWITIRQASEILRHIRPRTLYMLLGHYLVFRRPLPRKTVVSLDSVLALEQATQDAEFWNDPQRRGALRESVRREMKRLADEAIA